MTSREAFEKWARSMGYGDQLGEYKELDTFFMLAAWDAWQASRDGIEQDAKRYQRIKNGPHSDQYGDLYVMTFDGDGDYPVAAKDLDAMADRAISRDAE